MRAYCPEHVLLEPDVVHLLARAEENQALVDEVLEHGCVDVASPIVRDVVSGLLVNGRRMVVSRLANELGFPAEVVMSAALVLVEVGIVDLTDGGEGPGSVALVFRGDSWPWTTTGLGL